MGGDVLGAAMQVTTQRQADELIAVYIAQLIEDQPELEPATADYIARQNIGYYAGRYADSTRERVERLFKTAHPVFGAIKYNGPPTSEQAFALGTAYGEAMREKGSGRRNVKDPREVVADIPRVDARRVPYLKPTGIITRALATNGKFEDVDIATLTCDSLVRFLRSRGGRNLFAEAMVLQILGYDVPDSMQSLPRVK